MDRSIEVNGPGSAFETLNAWNTDFTAIRRDLHTHPETAFQERRTGDVIAAKLSGWGIEVHRGLAETGVVGVIRRGTGPGKIGLRADMDALDLVEESEFAHRSVHKGKMHACGHDGHCASLLAAARLLAERGGFDGTVTLIFQPAEENEGGGRRMVQEGLFDRFPCDTVFGLHNIPGIPLGRFAVGPGAMMAGFDIFEIAFVGVGGHAAMPHMTRDPIPALAAFVTGAQSIVARNIPPNEAAVLSVTQISGGSTYNVVPERASAAGTVRHFSSGTQQTIERRLRQLAEHVATAHDVTARIRYEQRYPATVNSAAEAKFCADVIAELFGENQVDRQPTPMMAAEDFAFLLQQRPGAYVWAGNGEGVGSPMLHNPRYDFNDALIPYAANFWIGLARAALPVSIG